MGWAVTCVGVNSKIWDSTTRDLLGTAVHDSAKRTLWPPYNESSTYDSRGFREFSRMLRRWSMRRTGISSFVSFSPILATLAVVPPIPSLGADQGVPVGPGKVRRLRR